MIDYKLNLSEIVENLIKLDSKGGSGWKCGITTCQELEREGVQSRIIAELGYVYKIKLYVGRIEKLKTKE